MFWFAAFSGLCLIAGLYRDLIEPLLGAFFASTVAKPARLSYELLEMKQVSAAHGFDAGSAQNDDAFSRNFDDDFLTNYVLLKFAVENARGMVSGPLTFRIYAGNRKAKILDVKASLKRPKNKTISVKTSLPNLRWKWPATGVRSLFSWEIPEPIQSVAGFNLYRSVVKTGGFGRVNSLLITNTTYALWEKPYRTTESYFYRLTAVDTTGQEGEPSEPIESENGTALATSFEGAEWFAPISPPAGAGDGSWNSPYGSLSDAITRSPDAQVYILDDDAATATSLGAPPLSHPVLTRSDFDFLRGVTRISLEKGFDSKGLMELSVLCKPLPGVELRPSMELVDSAGVILENVTKASSSQIFRGAKPTSVLDAKKQDLTPRTVSTTALRDKIILVWDKPRAEAYEGVTIYRSAERQVGDFESGNLGVLVFSGYGKTNTLKVLLRPDSRAPLNAHRAGAPMNVSYLLEPPIPPRPAPKPPTGSSLMGVGIRDVRAFADQLQNARDPLSAFLKTSFSANARQLLAKRLGDKGVGPPESARFPMVGPMPPNYDRSSLRGVLVTELQRVLRVTPAYEPQRLTGITLANDTKRLLAQMPAAGSEDLLLLNWLLLRDAYPLQIGVAKKPASPTSLSISLEENLPPDSIFFSDDGVAPNARYTYTLFARDSEGNYSYPVVINASTLDAADGVQVKF